MDFGTAIKVCFSKYVEFSGRARRSEFWFFYLFYVLLITGLSIVDGAVGGSVFSDIGVLAMFLPLLAASVRRLHDVNKSGWFILIPIYNIVLFATDSDPAPNRFGVPVK